MAKDQAANYVQSFYTRQGEDCTSSRVEVSALGTAVTFTRNTSIGTNLQNLVSTDLRNFGLHNPLWPDVALPGSTNNILQDGKLCYLSVAADKSNVNFAQYLGYNVLNTLFRKSFNFFFRVQDIVISQKPVMQVQQTFDGIYAGVYGGGLGSIKLRGITALYSGVEGGMQRSQPVNLEIEVLEKLMIVMANARGLVFNFHDGIQARKWPCIPQSFTTTKSANATNLQTYDISFLCGSFNQSFRHQSASGQPNLFGLVGMSSYPRRNAT